MTCLWWTLVLQPTFLAHVPFITLGLNKKGKKTTVHRQWSWMEVVEGFWNKVNSLWDSNNGFFHASQTHCSRISHTFHPQSFLVFDVQEVYSTRLIFCHWAPFCLGQLPSTYAEQQAPNLQIWLIWRTRFSHGCLEDQNETLVQLMECDSVNAAKKKNEHLGIP